MTDSRPCSPPPQPLDVHVKYGLVINFKTARVLGNRGDWLLARTADLPFPIGKPQAVLARAKVHQRAVAATHDSFWPRLYSRGLDPRRSRADGDAQVRPRDKPHRRHAQASGPLAPLLRLSKEHAMFLPSASCALRDLIHHWRVGRRTQIQPECDLQGREYARLGLLR